MKFPEGHLISERSLFLTEEEKEAMKISKKGHLISERSLFLTEKEKEAIKSPEEMPHSQRAEGATPIKFPIRPRSAGISRPDKPGSGKASREEVGQTWVKYPQADPGTPGCKGTPEPRPTCATAHGRCRPPPEPR